MLLVTYFISNRHLERNCFRGKGSIIGIHPYRIVSNVPYIPSVINCSVLYPHRPRWGFYYRNNSPKSFRAGRDNSWLANLQVAHGETVSVVLESDDSDPKNKRRRKDTYCNVFAKVIFQPCLIRKSSHRLTIFG